MPQPAAMRSMRSALFIFYLLWSSPCAQRGMCERTHCAAGKFAFAEVWKPDACYLAPAYCESQLWKSAPDAEFGYRGLESGWCWRNSDRIHHGGAEFRTNSPQRHGGTEKTKV